MPHPTHVMSNRISLKRGRIPCFLQAPEITCRLLQVVCVLMKYVGIQQTKKTGKILTPNQLIHFRYMMVLCGSGRGLSGLYQKGIAALTLVLFFCVLNWLLSRLFLSPHWLQWFVVRSMCIQYFCLFFAFIRPWLSEVTDLCWLDPLFLIPGVTMVAAQYSTGVFSGLTCSVILECSHSYRKVIKSFWILFA